MKGISFKTLLPYIVAIVLFLVVTISYLSPLLEGKQLKQSDTMNWLGSAKETIDFRKANPGEEPLWTNSMFGGMPSYQITMLTPSTDGLSWVLKILTLGLPAPAGVIFLYFLGFFILLRVLKVNPWLSIAGAFAFGFSTYFFIIIEAGHNTKADAISIMPFVLAGIFLVFQRKYLWGGLMTALFLAIEVKMNHLQMSYYLFIFILIFGLVETVHLIFKKEILHLLKSAGILLIALTFGVLANITLLWTTYEYSPYTIRGASELTAQKSNNATKGLDFDYATAWSYGKAETFTFFIPGFQGGSSNGKLSESSETYQVLKQNGVPNAKEIIKQMPTYWGPQPFTSGPVYAGALVMFLFVFAMFVVKGRMKWVLFAGTMLSFMLSWGENFEMLSRFFFNYFPLYNKFRAVSSILVIAELTIPILAMLGLNEVFKPDVSKKSLIKPLLYSGYIMGGLALLFVVFGGGLFDFASKQDQSMLSSGYPQWLIDALISDRKSMLTMDSLRSLLFVAIGFGLIWAYLKDKLKAQWVFAGLILVMIFDLYPVNKRYFGNENFTAKRNVENPFTPDETDALILEDKDADFRVLNVAGNPFNESQTSYFHKSAGGYHGAKLRRYQELIERQISKNNVAVFNMLNIRYFIIPDQQNGGRLPQRNVSALGNVWFVNNYIPVKNADEEIAALDYNAATHTGFKPDSIAIVDKRFEGQLKGFVPGKDSTSTIKLVSYKPNHLIYEADCKKGELAVFSEIYYDKGWDVTIDGKHANYLRVNYVLRAMLVPQGKHKIEFSFKPKSYYTGEKIGYGVTVILIMSLLGLLVYSGFRYFKQK